MIVFDIVDYIVDGLYGFFCICVYMFEVLNGFGLVWVYGGGFVGGDFDMLEVDVVVRVFVDCGIVVVSVDYCLVLMIVDWIMCFGFFECGGMYYFVLYDEVVVVFCWVFMLSRVFCGWVIGGVSVGGNFVIGVVFCLVYEQDLIFVFVVFVYLIFQVVQDVFDVDLCVLLDVDLVVDVFILDFVCGMYENYFGGDIDGVEIYVVFGVVELKDFVGFLLMIMINDEIDELWVFGEVFVCILMLVGVEVIVVVEFGIMYGYFNCFIELVFVRMIEQFVVCIL